MSVLEQVQADVRTAMKAGDRERAAALRMIVDALQKEAKLGDGSEVAVLQRERKKRIEAPEAYRCGRRERRQRAEADGPGDVGADAEGRRARRWQAGQRGGA